MWHGGVVVIVSSCSGNCGVGVNIVGILGGSGSGSGSGVVGVLGVVFRVAFFVVALFIDKDFLF